VTVAAPSLAAEEAEREAFAAVGALGRRELDAIKAWVAADCEGPKPKPDAEARRVLSERLARAVEAREALSRRGDS
jgi:hypothetical protein